jgi:4-hydroxy-3-polyprenylbenzoate decarboxylase
MNFNSLLDFIKVLEANGELLRIKEFVNPTLQIAEITDRISKQKDRGKALLFENTGSEFPILINAFGSNKRMCLAFGVENLDEIPTEINNLAKSFAGANDNFFEKLKVLSTLKSVADLFPKSVKGKGKCQEIVDLNPDLSKLPVLKCWPHDGGKFITLPLVHTKNPRTGIRNCGMYRLQIFNEKTTGMHWHLHKTGASHYREYKELGIKKMPVAVALGGDPIYTFCATAPLPENIDEYLFAGFLRKKKVEMVKCITQDIEVPADADIIIEGYIDTEEEKILEGPFGDHTGFYSLADYYPKFHVTCITHRKKAVFPATIVGIPPQEDAYIGEATEKIFLAPIKLAFLPELENMHLPIAGVAHNITIIKINQTYAGQAMKVANSLWGAGQMMFNKIMIVTNSETDVHEYKKLFSEIVQNIEPKRDIFFGNGPLDILDHSSSEYAFGSKICLDFTRKSEKLRVKNEELRVKSEKLEINLDEVVSFNQLDDFSTLILSVNEKFNRKIFFEKLKQNESVLNFKFVIIVNQEIDLNDLFTVVWFVSGNIDPKRDCLIHENTIFVDGTIKANTENFKREWPNVIVSDDKTIQEIDQMWSKLNIGEFINSPSLQFKNLVKNSGATYKIS